MILIKRLNFHENPVRHWGRTQLKRTRTLIEQAAVRRKKATTDCLSHNRLLVCLCLRDPLALSTTHPFLREVLRENGTKHARQCSKAITDAHEDGGIAWSDVQMINVESCDWVSLGSGCEGEGGKQATV